MATPKYLEIFKAFIDSEPGFLHLPGMEKEFYLGSDRAAVILQAANVGETLERVIKAKMRQNLSSDDKDRIFEGNGPLSNFSHKILVGYALGIYGNMFKHDLNLIRELRNGFAHVRLPMFFTTPEIAGVCERLQLPDSSLQWLPHAYSEKFDLEIVTDDKHPRTRFTRACHTIALCLIDKANSYLGKPVSFDRELP